MKHHTFKLLIAVLCCLIAFGITGCGEDELCEAIDGDVIDGDMEEETTEQPMLIPPSPQNAYHEHHMSDTGDSVIPDNNDTVMTHLEHPDSDDVHEKDTGNPGYDEIPFNFLESHSHTFCWEGDPGDNDPHHMILENDAGEEVARVEEGGDCVTVDVKEDQRYVKKLYHGGDREGEDSVIFIRPRPAAAAKMAPHKRPDSPAHAAAAKDARRTTSCAYLSTTTYGELNLDTGQVAVFGSCSPGNGDTVYVFDGNCDNLSDYSPKALGIGPNTQAMVFASAAYDGSIYLVDQSKVCLSDYRVGQSDPEVANSNHSMRVWTKDDSDPHNTCDVVWAGLGIDLASGHGALQEGEVAFYAETIPYRNTPVCDSMSYDDCNTCRTKCCKNGDCNYSGCHSKGTTSSMDSYCCSKSSKCKNYGHCCTNRGLAMVLNGPCHNLDALCWNQTISTLSTGPNTVVYLYKDVDYGGESFAFQDTVYDLNTFNNAAQSLYIESRTAYDTTNTLLTTDNCNSCYLVSANLQGTDLHGKSISSANLTGANLESANLMGCNLDSSILTRARLDDANMENVHAHGARFSGAIMAYANLKNATLTEAIFERTDTVGPADLSYAYMPGANLGNAHLNQATMSYVHLYGTGATVESATMDGTEFSNAILSGLNLGQAKMSGAHLAGANLVNTNLRGAHLEGATLVNAHLEGADFSGAFFKVSGAASGTRMANAAVAREDGTMTVQRLGDNNTLETVIINYTATTFDEGATDASVTCPDGTPGPCTCPADGSTPCHLAAPDPPSPPECVPSPDQWCPRPRRASR